MNRRAIKAVLAKKHKAFCESIDDVVVKKLVEENSIITGGCIASMLLGEPVKDFDYYFTNRETALAVANYYVGYFLATHPDMKDKTYVEMEGDRICIRVRADAQVNFTEAERLAALNVEGEPSDEEMHTELAAEDKDKPAYRPVFLSANAITLSDKIQLVIRFYGSPEEIHSNYDFSHCTCQWTSGDQKLLLPAEALESLLVKHLFYQGSLYPLCSIIRTRKFIKRGWHINAGQYLKMCFQLSELDLKSIPVLEDQLVGVDATYFRQVIEYCKKRQEEDPNSTITAPYLVTIVDAIFG